MAYVPGSAQKKEEEDQTPNPLAQQAPVTTSSGIGAGPASKGTASSQGPSQPFTNLSSYLSANAPQIQAQGDKIASDLTSQYGQTKSSIDTAAQDFRNKISQGYQAPNQALIDEATSNPTQFASDPDKVKAFQSQFNFDYQGPEDFTSQDNYSNLLNSVQGSSEEANLVNSIPGLQTYLQKGKNTTRGQNVLDTVLLQGNPEAYTKVQEAAKPFNTLSDYLGTTTQSLNQEASQAKSADQAQADAVRNRFLGESGILPTTQNSINTKVQGAQTQAEKNLNDITAALTNYRGNVSDEILSQLGVSREDWNLLKQNMDVLEGYKSNNIPGFSPYTGQLSLNSFLQQRSPADINRSTVADQNDYAIMAALQALTGEDTSGFLNPSNASLAGTAPSSLANFDSAKAQQDLRNAVKAQDQRLFNQFSGNLARTDWSQVNDPVDVALKNALLRQFPERVTSGGGGGVWGF